MKKVEILIRSLKPDEVINISLSEQLQNCNLSVMQNNALRNGALSTLSGFIRCSDEEDMIVIGISHLRICNELEKSFSVSFWSNLKTV